MKNFISFMKDLQVNNDRAWFEQNRGRYELALKEYTGFAADLIARISAFDPTVASLGVRDVTYRIYRDTRFSKNKAPYKSWLGVYINMKGKKSGYGGYYVHFEPSGGDFFGTYFLTSGIYMPESFVLRSVREDILDRGEEFLALAKKAKGFEISHENKLKRTPTGFPTDSPYDDYLKLKDVYLEKKVDEQFMLEDNLATRIAAEFKKTRPFLDFLNRAVHFAYEEQSGL